MREAIIAAAALAACLVAAPAQAANVDVRVETGSSRAHPQTNISRGSPYNYWIVGGGARANWTGAGSLLTAAYPYRHFNVRFGAWAASAKDHQVSDPTNVTGFMMTINDPGNLYETIIVEGTGEIAAHPGTQAVLPEGYVLTGGGCNVRWDKYPNAAGSLLTGSYPAPLGVSSDYTTWVCRAKDHNLASPAYVTAYAIGIRARGAGTPQPQMRVCQAKTPSPVAHPTAEVGNCWAGHPNARITGGGAYAETAAGGAGQLLTASFPAMSAEPGTTDSYTNPTRWVARAKDHVTSSPGQVTAFAILVDF